MRPMNVVRVGAALAVLLIPALLIGADRPKRATKVETPFEAETVELFAAMKEGLIETTVIPLNDQGANVFVRNKSDKPLSVRVPKAVVAVPETLKQQGGGGGFGGGGGGSLGGGSLGGSGGSQGLGGGLGSLGGGSLGGGGGGGFGGGGGGLGGGGGGALNPLRGDDADGAWNGGGFLNVPLAAKGTRHKVAKVMVKDQQRLKLDAVCLDHGKEDPRPSMKNYKLVAVDEYTQDPVMRALLVQIANGRISRAVAQAAAWHVNNDMSWAELAAKRVKRAVGPGELYFAPGAVASAQTYVQYLESAAAEAKASGALKSEPASLGTAPSAGQ